jgi:hypothetical protein
LLPGGTPWLRRLHGLAVLSDPLGERPEGIGIGPDGQGLDRPTVLVEHAYIELLTRQVQSDV